MVFIPTANTVKASLEFLQNGVPVVNVFHVDIGHAPAGTDLTAVALKVVEWWEDSLSYTCHNSLLFNQVIVTDISVANGGQHTENTTTQAAGRLGGTAQAANAAATITWKTAHIGRSYRGRTYLGALDDSLLTDAQHLTTTAVTNYTAIATSLVTGLSSLGYALVVLSKFANGVARVAGLITEIITVVTDSKIDSQRRRTAN